MARGGANGANDGAQPSTNGANLPSVRRRWQGTGRNYHGRVLRTRRPAVRSTCHRRQAAATAIGSDGTVPYPAA